MPRKGAKSSDKAESKTSLEQFAASRSTDRPTVATKEKEELSTVAERHYSDKWRIPERKDWMEMPLDRIHELIQKLLATYQEGAAIYNQRTSDAQRESGVYKCIVCGKKKPLTVDNGSRPNYVWRDDRPDPQTRVYTSRIICSQECFFRGSNSGQLTNRGVNAQGTAFRQEDQAAKVRAK